MKIPEPRQPEIRPNECMDDFGSLKIIQSKDGYRFSLDALLLSDFATTHPGDVVVDLGTGCGIMLLLLLTKRPIRLALGVEIQKELASQALRNAACNGFQDRMGVVVGDLKHPPGLKGCADVVICNPPYRRLASGRINPDLRRAVARHEIRASLDDILQAGSWLLKPKGRLATVYPAERLVDVLTRLRKRGIEPKRVRIAYPTVDSGASLALVEGVSGGRPGLKIDPPLLGQGAWEIENGKE